MTTLSLKPLELTPEQKQDTQRLAVIESSLAEITKQLINKNIDTIEAETQKIQKFAQGITEVLQKLTNYKDECSRTISDLEKQMSELSEKIKTYEKDFKNNNKETEYKKQIQSNQKKYLAEWEKRIQIANKIDTDSLLKVEIEDRKSKANEVFKWIIATIYGEPQSKFYWPNFREQIFVRDEGADFKTRLGKINASNAKEEQKVKTVEFLKGFKEIADCKQLKKVQSQIEDIRKVAQIFLTCYELAQKIRELEKAIEKSREESRERDEQAMRWKARSQALSDRVKTNKQYLNILKKIQSYLAGKTQNYTEKENTAKDIVQKLKNNESIIGPIDIGIEDEKRDHCECNIF